MMINNQRKKWLLGLILGTALILLTSSTGLCCNPHARTLIRGAALPSTNGIYISSEGNLYVTSVLARTILRLDPDTGKPLEKLGPDIGVDTPDDLVIDRDGTIYFTSYFSGTVGRITPERQVSTLATIGPGVNAITLSDDGRLFVSRVFIADDLWEVDLQGIEQPRLIAENLGGFNGMDMGPDGLLYGPIWFKGQIGRINVDTGELDVVAEGLDTPAAVKFDAFGKLHTVEQHSGNVTAIDVETGEKTTLAHISPGLDNLAFGPQGQLYVSQAHEGAIYKVHPLRGTTMPLGHIGLTTPGGVALQKVNGKTSLFVADTYTLQEFHPRSGHTRHISHSILGSTTELNTPMSVSAYGQNLILTSWFANSVQIYDPRTHSLTETHTDFAYPLNAIEFQQGFAVSELGTGSVTYRPAGTLDKVVLASGLTTPTGLAGNQSDLYCADRATGTIYQIVKNDEPVFPPIVIAAGLFAPEGMAMTPQGNLIVAEAAAGQLTRIDLETGQKTALLTDLAMGAPGVPGFPPTWAFNDVTVSSNGTVYVTLDEQRDVLTFRLKE